MLTLVHSLQLCAPLFTLVFVGYAIARWPRWQPQWTQRLSLLVLHIALPAMLFHLLSGFSTLPPVDPRLLLAFFGGCLLVFAGGRAVGARWFQLDDAAQSVFAMGGVFSNNVMLGLPLARITLGPPALPTVALIVVFNALILWTLLALSIEWSRQGSLTLQALGKTARSVIATPLIAGILAGTGFGMTGFELPVPIERALAALGSIAGPGALLVLGMGLAQYSMQGRWRESLAICGLKLLCLPIAVWCLAKLLAVPPVETSAIVLLASMAVGANVYLMAAQYRTLQATVAASLVTSTAFSALTTPVLLWVIGAA